MKALGLFLGILGLTILAFDANAQIAVVPTIVNFTADDSPRTDIVVSNEADNDSYVKIVPNIVVFPGTIDEKKIVIRDPEKYGLLVTPQQLIIPPHQRRMVRLMLTKPLDNQERIYRIAIFPVAKELVPNYSIQKEGKTIGLQVLVGYEVLAMARAINSEWGLQLQRKGKTLFLHNNGNTNVLISTTKQCMNKQCVDIKKFMRLYAGNTMQIPLQFPAPATVDAYMFDNKKTFTSN